MGVKKKKSQFRATEMFVALKSDNGPPLSITGLVKEKDDDPAAVHLALPPHADRWLAIPEDSITSYEPLAKLSINDADHQIVRLNLKRPDTPAGAMFHDLLAAQIAGSRALAQHVATEGGNAAAVTAAYCYYDATGRWICI